MKRDVKRLQIELDRMEQNPFLYQEEVEEKLSKSLEDYLEVIFVIGQVQGEVRCIDVAGFLHFSKPSISNAVKLLKKSGHLTKDSDGRLLLTPKGKAAAMKIYDKHQFMTSFFTSIGVEPQIAEQDACFIEHIISDESFYKLKEIYKYKEVRNETP